MAPNRDPAHPRPQGPESGRSRGRRGPPPLRSLRSLRGGGPKTIKVVYCGRSKKIQGRACPPRGKWPQSRRTSPPDKRPGPTATESLWLFSRPFELDLVAKRGDWPGRRFQDGRVLRSPLVEGMARLEAGPTGAHRRVAGTARRARSGPPGRHPPQRRTIGRAKSSSAAACRSKRRPRSSGPRAPFALESCPFTIEETPAEGFCPAQFAENGGFSAHPR